MEVEPTGRRSLPGVKTTIHDSANISPFRRYETSNYRDGCLLLRNRGHPVAKRQVGKTPPCCQKPDPDFRSLSFGLDRQRSSSLRLLGRSFVHSALGPYSFSSAVFAYCHPVVFTVARCHSFGAGESSCSQSSSCPEWHLCCHLPHARHGIVVVVFLPTRRGLRYAQQTSLMRGGLLSCPVRPSVCAAVFRSARRGMRGGLPFCSAWHARRSSFPPGAACAAVFRSAQCGIHGGILFCLAQPGMCSSVPFCLARPGVRGGVPFCPARHRCSVLSGAARCVLRSSVLPGAACAAFFRSARCCMRGVLPFRPGRHARRSPVSPGAAYAAVFRSLWRGPVCAAVFCSARHGIGVPFCLAQPGLRGGPQFCPSRHARRSCVLLGAPYAVFFRSAWGGMCSRLPFRPVRHTRRCSVLSGAARYARRCCGSVIGGPGSLVALLDDPVVIGAGDPRSRCWFRHAAQRCVKVGQGR